MKTKSIIAFVVVLIVGFIAGYLTNQSFSDQQAAVISSTSYDNGTGLMSAGTDCGDNVSMGTATLNNLIFSINPGVTKTIRWDFTGCWFGLQNFTVYLTKPRTKSGSQQALASNTPLKVTAINKTTGQSASGTNFFKSFGYADHSIIEVTMTNTGTKALDLQGTHTETMGGLPIR